LVLSSNLSSKLARWGCSLLVLVGLAHATTETKKPVTKKTVSSTAHPKTSKSTRTSAKSSSHKTAAKGKKSRKTVAKKRGQQNIDSARAREIQEALIRDGYMQGEASGTWDQSSQKAMEKFQADNGWQSKVVPDSRALIKLGLGPDHEHLLNPESAMTSQPEPPRASPMLNQSPAMVTLPQK